MLISEEDLRFMEDVVMGKGPRYEKSCNPYLEQFDERYEVCIPEIRECQPPVPEIRECQPPDFG